MKDQYYTGKALTPPVTVKHGKKLLVEGTDYTATYRNNVKVGTARVTLKGAGRYTGTLKVTFSIQARIKLSKCKATVKDQVYIGKAIKPAVTVKYGKQTLKQGRDYTVTFKNNKKVGTATAVLKGAGRYTGTKKLTFAINPAAPAIAGLKAGKVTITCKAADGSKRYAKIKLTFGANELKQTVKPVNGELITAPSRMRYVSGQLEVRMTFRNRTGASVQIPGPGVLTLVTPEGEQIPLMPLAASRQYTLRNKDSRTIRYRVPVGAQTAGLDLTRSGAVISGAPVP